MLGTGCWDPGHQLLPLWGILGHKKISQHRAEGDLHRKQRTQTLAFVTGVELGDVPLKLWVVPAHRECSLGESQGAA